MAVIIDGKSIADAILNDVKKRAAAIHARGDSVRLAVVLVGGHAPSLLYVKKKQEAALRAGILCEVHTFPNTISESKLIGNMRNIQNDSSLSGLIVQLPLPEHLSTLNILSVINPDLDVDCLSPASVGALESGHPTFVPPTAGAVLSILEHLKCDIKKKRVAIFGRGPLVGKPLAILFSEAGADVTVIHSKTENPAEKSRRADIIVSGVGKKKLITGDMVKFGAIVIDAGSMVEQGKMYGDIDMESVKPVAGVVAPSPGGVGPITVARLLENTVMAAESPAADEQIDTGAHG